MACLLNQLALSDRSYYDVSGVCVYMGSCRQYSLKVTGQQVQRSTHHRCFRTAASYRNRLTGLQNKIFLFTLNGHDHCYPSKEKKIKFYFS